MRCPIISHELNTLVEAENENGYYSAKDVAELFDVNKQTVYKCAEDKIEYKKDNSLGKTKRNGYHILKTEFQTIEKVNKTDATFHERRKKEMEDIPDTGFDPNSVTLSKSGKNPVSHHEMKNSSTEKINE